MISRMGSSSLPVIGMIHVPPLPGSPGYAGNPERVRDAVMADAAALVEGGVDGLMIENFGDSPFYPGRVPRYVVAHMTVLAAQVRRAFDLPLGINVLRNDGRSALAIAHAVNAQFIRVNVLCGARVTDQGVIQGIAHDLMRDRARLGGSRIQVLADINVKHSAPLGQRPIAEEVRDMVLRGRADGVIVSGESTGAAVDVEELATVHRAAADRPVWIGSGVSIDTLQTVRPYATGGLIVGTAFKHEGDVNNPVDKARVRAFMDAVRDTMRA